MTLEVSSDDLLALLDNIEEWFLLDEPRLRGRVGRLRDRIRALEAENARLRAALNRATSDAQAPGEQSAPHAASGDPWAVPGEPAAPPRVAAEEPAPRRGARFACRKCGELHDEADLRRVDGALVCASCDVSADEPPVSRGTYR